MKRSFVREILEAIDADTISFAGGLPDESLFPVAKIQKAAQKALCSNATLQYSVSGGIMSLRQKIAAYYCSLGVDTAAENILITTGAQQALDLISRAYFRGGVTVESPAYLGALGSFTANGCPLDSVKLMDIEAFEKSFSKTKRAYLMCDFQNPTGKSYAVDTRRKIAQIAAEQSGIVVEDGAYMELFFDERLPIIASFAPSNVLHVGSFSKILAPGLRLGWIRGEEELLKPILALKERADLHTSTLSQMIADEFWSDGGFDGHLEDIRDIYATKAKYLGKQLRSKIPEFVFEEPRGGMFIYGSFPRGTDTRALAYKCLAAGAVFVPGGEFYEGAPINNEARFNFTHSSYEQMERGVDIIANVYGGRV
jgi:DNA-binding transcriptional MocR family regulator